MKTIFLRSSTEIISTLNFQNFVTFFYSCSINFVCKVSTNLLLQRGACYVLIKICIKFQANNVLFHQNDCQITLYCYFQMYHTQN